MFNPDRWQIVRIGGKDPHYKVFAVWSGGYSTPEQWRMNSGITRVEQDEQFYYFHGASNSVYMCDKASYGTNTYGAGVLMNMIEHFERKGQGKDFEPLPNQDWMKVDWLISETAPEESPVVEEVKDDKPTKEKKPRAKRTTRKVSNTASSDVKTPVKRKRQSTRKNSTSSSNT